MDSADREAVQQCNHIKTEMKTEIKIEIKTEIKTEMNIEMKTEIKTEEEELQGNLDGFLYPQYEGNLLDQVKQEPCSSHIKQHDDNNYNPAKILKRTYHPPNNTDKPDTAQLTQQLFDKEKLAPCDNVSGESLECQNALTNVKRFKCNVCFYATNKNQILPSTKEHILVTNHLNVQIVTMLVFRNQLLPSIKGNILVTNHLNVQIVTMLLLRNLILPFTKRVILVTIHLNVQCVTMLLLGKQI